MPHWKSYQDPGIWLGPADFDTEKTVTISRVEAESGEDNKKIMVMIFSHNGKEIPRKLQVAKSSRYALSLFFRSDDTDKWIGKEVTLYATKCLAFGDVEPCVRFKVGKTIDDKVKKWMKKRKASPRAYIDEGAK